MKRPPTEAQKQAAKERRERMRAIAKRIGEMEEGERQAIADRAGIHTIEGRSLSCFNQCMILAQDAGASVVGGFRQWRAAGRHVRKGARGLALWIPLGPGAEAPTADALEEGTGKRPRFVLGTVFDITQTDPADATEAGGEVVEEAEEPEPVTAPARLSLFAEGPAVALLPAPVRVEVSPAAKLQAMADALGPKIEALRRDRLSNTPKRQYQAMAARCDAANLDRVRVALATLAQGWTLGTIPHHLRHLRTRAAVEPLVTRIIDHPSYYVACESQKWRTETPEAEALRAWLAVMASPADDATMREAAQRDHVRAMEEAVRFTPIPGFFPTPPAIVEMMTERAGLFDGAKVLEPSAGKGDIAEAARAAGAQVVCFEIVHALADICRAKGLECERADFTEMQPVAGFDRVLMNPPFERGQDTEHVLRAFEWLKPGGRLVSVMSASFTFNRAFESFREWLDELGAVVEDLPADAFKGAFRSTSVACKLVTIDKAA